MQIEEVILDNLISNEDYTRKVLPFLQPEYFNSNANKIVFEQINQHLSSYNALPTVTELMVTIGNLDKVSQSDYDETVSLLESFNQKTKSPSIDWLTTQTEDFCKERAVYNVIVDAAGHLDAINENGIFKLGSIPQALQDALSITFDTNIGLSYDSFDDRWERRRTRKADKVPFSIEDFNEATNGGMDLKTVTVVAGGTGGGKSAFMCAQAAHNMSVGNDVLYISMEMDEDAILDRVDANILNIDLDDMLVLPKQDYLKRIKNKVSDAFGKLIVKEYPTAGAGVLEFRALLHELKLKKGFIPKLIVVDYLNICTSSRFRADVANSYTLVKSIAEELRGLAKEFNVAILTGTQLNRDGVDNTNVSLKEISESAGLSHTVDCLFTIMRTEELDALNQIMIKQLKNRFADMAKKLKFTIGYDRAKFKYFSVDKMPEVNAFNSKQNGSNVDEDGVVTDNNTTPWSGNFGVSKKRRNFSSLGG